MRVPIAYRLSPIVYHIQEIDLLCVSVYVCVCVSACLRVCVSACLRLRLRLRLRVGRGSACTQTNQNRTKWPTHTIDVNSVQTIPTNFDGK